MPFDFKTLHPIGGNSRPGAAPSLWGYRTTDTLGVVLASGYFDQAKTLLAAGDMIAITASAGSATETRALYSVSAVSPSIVVGPANSTARLLTVTPLAVANTNFSLGMPDPARILRITTITTTAFTGATATLRFGSTQAGEQVSAALDIKAAGAALHTLVQPAAWNLAGGTLFAQLVQGTPTAVGAATAVIEFGFN